MQLFSGERFQQLASSVDGGDLNFQVEIKLRPCSGIDGLARSVHS
jgi:hypothetical protein